MDDPGDEGNQRFEPLLEELARLRQVIAAREGEMPCLLALDVLSRSAQGTSVDEFAKLMQSMVDLVPHGFFSPREVSVEARGWEPRNLLFQ